MELSVSRSVSDGRDVLYVGDARTGEELGRYDRGSGQLEVADPTRVQDVAEALWDYLEHGAVRHQAIAEAAPAAPVAAAAPGMAAPSEPATVPEPADTAEPPEPATASEPAVTAEPAEPPEPATVEEPAGSASPTPPRALWNKAGRVVDRALAPLRRDGWAVLSPGGKRVGADFDRLIIGPAGVFALTVKHAGGTEAGAHDRGHDAWSATRMLSAGTGLPVKVKPVIVFVGNGFERIHACGFTGRDGEPCDVLTARGENLVEVLWSLPARYSAQERRRFLDVARRADLWRAA